MVALAVVAAVAMLALAAALVLLQRSHREAQAQWALERRELLNRIQRPEIIPTAPVAFEVPEREDDEWNKVGTVEISDEWLNSDE